ncbi:MAG: hypothetical protein WD772_08005 [Pseudohongiellaceae bacterium]
MTQRAQRKTQKTRSAAKEVNIDQQLVAEGIAQLASEIKVLETWLTELESSAKSDSDAIAARKSYNDMLRSRKEMLSALNKHAHKAALSS